MVFQHIYSVFLQTIGRYVLRGCGKQGLGTLIVLFSFYVMSLPLGITLILKSHLKMMGKCRGSILHFGYLIKTIRVRGSVPGLGGLKETKNVSSPSTCESQYCGEPP